MMGLAACALILTSCNRQEITETVNDNDGQLAFYTGLGKQSTKAAELMNTSLQNAATSTATGIILKTYQEITLDGGVYKPWFNDTLSYDKPNTEWKITTKRFRNTVGTKYISYFPRTNVVEKDDAATPGKTTFETADFDTKLPQITYTIADNTNQKDLIAGIVDAKANVTDITLGMRHILSQVNFGTVGYSGANITIQNIKIVGLYNSGTFTYNKEDGAPLGTWNGWGTNGVTTSRDSEYEYYGYSNTAAIDNPQPSVTADDDTHGDTYVYGDGGNAGPGRNEDKWYPIGTTANDRWQNAPVSDPISLGNSLILMPQKFKDVPGAKVTFEYQITDVDGAYVAGGPDVTDWEKGEFKLDFSENGTSGTDYISEWEPNYRYVYLIDFTDFLDGISLTFDVDVETNLWQNYNENGDNDGEVNVILAGQPSQKDMNAPTFVNNSKWYIATQSATAPNGQQWAQVVRNETWNLNAYDFTQIESGQAFELNFNNVIFNTTEDPATGTPTTITMMLPPGYTAGVTAGSTGVKLETVNATTYKISADQPKTPASITITNTNLHYSTLASLTAAIKGATVDGTLFTYKGSAAVDLRTMEPTTLVTKDNTITVKFNKVKPTVGASTNGVWTWDIPKKTATWTRN